MQTKPLIHKNPRAKLFISKLLTQDVTYISPKKLYFKKLKTYKAAFIQTKLSTTQTQ